MRSSFFALSFYQYQAEKDLTLSDLRVKGCEQLPTLSEIDELFNKQQSRVSSLLKGLGACQNNVSVCSRYGSCIKENYKKRKVRSGNTVIEWSKVRECGSLNKGAIHISYTSACEGTKASGFFSTISDFKNIPVKYYNY